MRALMRKGLSDWHWLAFFALVLMAWAALFAMERAADMPSGMGLEFWAALCAQPTSLADYPAVFAMWALMSAAMMAPTFVPALRTYDDLATGGAASSRGFAELLVGYIAVWLGFSLVAAAAQLALARAGLLGPMGQSVAPWLTGGLLIGAGLYQFSALKEKCLSQCMEPFMFFLQHWREEDWNSLNMGLRLGAFCLGCCWALMLLAFVGGTMNLVWMGLATLFMVLEKLPQVGRVISRPVGGVLIAGGVATIIF